MLVHEGALTSDFLLMIIRINASDSVDAPSCPRRTTGFGTSVVRIVNNPWRLPPYQRLAVARDARCTKVDIRFVREHSVAQRVVSSAIGRLAKLPGYRVEKRPRAGHGNPVLVPHHLALGPTA